MTSIAKRLNNHFAACAAAAAGAAMLGVANKADAAIVWSGPINITIPSTTAGVYLNVVTGLNNANPASVPGWDVNPWGSTALSMFAPTGGGHVTTGTTGQYDNMTPGTAIGPASTFSVAGSAAINPAKPLILNSSNNLVGFKFFREGDAAGTLHYGWMRISLGSSAQAQPRAIVEYAYEDQIGVAINAGAVPAPGALALLGLAGVVGARRRRN